MEVVEVVVGRKTIKERKVRNVDIKSEEDRGVSESVVVQFTFSKS